MHAVTRMGGVRMHVMTRAYRLLGRILSSLRREVYNVENASVVWHRWNSRWVRWVAAMVTIECWTIDDVGLSTLVAMTVERRLRRQR